MKFMAIVWEDAVGSTDRIYPENLASLELAINCNYGWIADENAERIILAYGFGNTNEIDFIIIPVKSILKRITICNLNG